MMQKPNILWITSDQQHWFTLGCLNPEIRTPNLDRLAARGTLFERAYCPNPTCTPTRASLITGRFPSQHGAWSLGTKLDESIPTVGDIFQEGGYDSTLIGKAHFQQLLSTEEFPSLESYPLLRDLEYWKENYGPFYGFNHIELARNHADECHVGQHYALWMEEKGFDNWRDHFENQWGNKPFDFSDGKPINPPQYGAWTIPEEYHYNTWITERSCARMDHCIEKDQPFFLWASYFDPHPPYLVPEPWASMYDPDALTVPDIVPSEHDQNPIHFQMTQEESPDFSAWNEEGGNGMHGFHTHLESKEKRAKNMAIYYGMVSCMDAHIGKLLDHLDAIGQTDNTMVVFTSDHGHFFGQHGLKAKGPFHYEDVIRVPMIAAWPGKIPQGQRSSSIQSLVDIPVTCLKAAGLKPDPWMTGLDQQETWKGSDEHARTATLVEHHHQPTTIHVRTYVDARYKITIYLNTDEGEIFDLENDPGELRNLWRSKKHADLKSQLLLKLAQAELAREPLPMPRVAPA
ncbi:MAG: sulfatase-like hydrolase/transferase [Verrucomicrobiota bacterium]